jgi:hypothetical protein
MLALFSLRLAFGMLACLPLLPAAAVPPRFYRTHLLTALALCSLALVVVYDRAGGPLLSCLGASAVLLFLGSMLWRLEGAPGGQSVIAVVLPLLGACVYLLELRTRSDEPMTALFAGACLPGAAELLLGDFTSAALLGTALSAMLMGHSYLIAPGLTLTPLRRLLGAFFVAVLGRMAADGFALWQWHTTHSFASLGNDTVLWLPVRWLVGFALPLGLGWMAWQSARTRSTQSATGILYVVVVFCFLGELTGMLLRATTGLSM